MKKLTLLAVLLSTLLWLPASEAAVVWFAGMETGSVDGERFTTGGNCTTTTTSRSGAYSLDAGGNRSCGSPAGLALTTAYLRMYINVSFSGSSNQTVLKGRSSAAVEQLQLRIDQSTKLLNYTYAGGAVLATGTIPLVASTWYLIEIKFVNAAGTGGMEVKLDNVVQFSDFTRTTNTTGTIDHIQFGQYSATLLVDDILLSNSGYPGPGRSIARQGTAGSPTYDAWTKNSCSGGTIDNCWSATPVSTAANASSSTPTDAQTMLVHSFATTQSGHGTEVLASGDTINACRTVISAKAAAGSQLYIRRRLGGVDTDTLVNLSGSDVYYADALWTDTFTNLNAAEIGAVQNSGP